MEGVKSYVLDHHGIVAGVCDELGIVERINARIKSKDDRRIIQPGFAVKAMIINGLGFSNRQLYLTPQFYESKALGLLLGEGIKASDLNDHTLGKALDEIYAYGPTRLFGEVAFEIGHEKGLFNGMMHLDSTSFSVTGGYDIPEEPAEEKEASGSTNETESGSEEEAEEERSPLKVTYGYSKDHRPDLKQVMLSLVMGGASNLPLWMCGQDGNSSDKSEFPTIIQAVEAMKKQCNLSQDFTWIADSALYSTKGLLSIKDSIWVTRVPETVKEVKEILACLPPEEGWITYGNGYAYYEEERHVGGMDQRWLVVRSEQAKKRESATLEKAIATEEKTLNSLCWHLKNKEFACRKDAESHIRTLEKTLKYHRFTYEILPQERYAKAGRPSKEASKEVKAYMISATAALDTQKKEKLLAAKGIFILATNQLDKAKLPSASILENYKQQQSVEGGFRFLKDPVFMADTLYLKKPERIEALMVVMCLCLFVYNFAQDTLRKALIHHNQTLPNQKNKPIQNPTLKWIFQIMEGIAVVQFFDQQQQSWHSLISNLNPLRTQICKLLGTHVMHIYKIS
jgi:transposase